MLCQWKEDVFDISKSNSYPSFSKTKKRIENEAFDLKSHCIPLREMFWFENILYQVYMEAVKRKRKIDTIGWQVLGLDDSCCRAFTKDIIFARVYSDVSTSSRYC